MLEILVSLRRKEGNGVIGGSEKKEKKLGDILVAKKRPCVWGSEEKKNFLVTLLDDPELEERMGDKKVISYPYAVHEIDDDGNSVVVNRSKLRVKMSDFPDFTGFNSFQTDIERDVVVPESKSYLGLDDLLEDAEPRV